MRRSIVTIIMVLLASCSGGGGSANDQAAKSEKAAAAGGAGGGIALQPGQWELRTEVVRMNVPNMPQGMSPPAPPPTTVTYCLTPEQARQPNANFLTGSGEQGGCRAENMSMAGGRLHGTVQCEHQGATTRVEMAGQFTPTSYEINQTTHTSAQGMEMDIESRTAGRRIGDCPG